MDDCVCFASAVTTPGFSRLSHWLLVTLGELIQARRPHETPNELKQSLKFNTESTSLSHNSGLLVLILLCVCLCFNSDSVFSSSCEKVEVCRFLHQPRTWSIELLCGVSILVGPVYALGPD